MEIIDAGDVPLDQMIEQLLSDIGLRKLVGTHGAVCFVLVRSALAPEFYEQLIKNVDLIDTTTRHHIAFIVFHGNNVSIRQETGRLPWEFYEYHVNGLSVSGQPLIQLGERYVSDPGEITFNRDLVTIVRSNPRFAPLDKISRATESAASILLARYGISETSLPCLLFTDGNRTAESCMVRLSADEPLKSLYRDVLAPLSEEFRTLEKFWKKRAELDALLARRADAARKLDAYPVTFNVLQHERSHPKLPEIAMVESEIALLTEERDSLVALRCKLDSADTLEERIQLLPPNSEWYERVVSNQNRLKLLREKRELLAADTATEVAQLTNLTDQINGIWGLIEYTSREPQYKGKKRLKIIKQQLAELERRRNSLKVFGPGPGVAERIERLEKEHEDAQRIVDDMKLLELEFEQTQIEQMCERLRREGYGDEVIKAGRPAAIDVIKTLVTKGRVGIKGSGKYSKDEIVVLFLCANPRNTSSLDLEEEIRAVETELRSVSHRARIKLVSRFAVRPDDLLRYVRADAPDVVHFSGHGTSEGIVLRDDASGYQVVQSKALRRLFKDRGVRLVVLNACFSAEQAGALSTVVDTIIGTDSEVDDEAARRFSVAFYRTLGEGHSIGDAFRDGGDAIALYNLDDVYRMIGKTGETLLVASMDR